MSDCRAIPRWLLRSSAYHDRLSAQAARLLMGLYGGTVPGQVVPATARDLQIVSGVPTRGPRLLQQAAELVGAGLVRLVDDGYVLVESRREHEVLVRALCTPVVHLVYEVATIPEQPCHEVATVVEQPCHDHATPVAQPCHDRATPVPHSCHGRGTIVQDIPSNFGELQKPAPQESPNIDHKPKGLCTPLKGKVEGVQGETQEAPPPWPRGPDTRRELATTWARLFRRGSVRFASGDKRDKALTRALALYSPEQLTSSLEGYASDPWRHEEPGRNELATLMRDAAHIEAGIEKRSKRHAASSNSAFRPAGQYPGRGAAQLGYTDDDRDRAPRRGADLVGA